jgi:Raf kinase inhibitor-like YbhB/YbcL family protein
MNLQSTSIVHNAPIPEEYAFGVPAEQDHMALGANRSPHLAWSGAPEGTKSYAVICVDDDVPSKMDDFNQEGRTIPADLPRIDFYHWVLVDVPASVTELAAGVESDGITQGGKPPGPTDHGTRGVNDYTKFMQDDMAGDYGGYDGPCPPWNDSIVHHYHFTVYALDVEGLGLSGKFTGADAINALEGHVLDKATITGTYSLSPDVKA